jgi:hypothetical protein
MAQKANTLEDVWKFIDKKEEDECWLWTNATTGGGYGTIRINNKKYPTHRLVYELNYGKIPDGMHVCHKCDNPPCCNPSHLFLGTHKDNMLDKMKKCRQRRNSGNSKITEDDVREIRRLHGTITQKKLAEKFGIVQTTVSRIVFRERWKHVI